MLPWKDAWIVSGAGSWNLVGLLRDTDRVPFGMVGECSKDTTSVESGGFEKRATNSCMNMNKRGLSCGVSSTSEANDVEKILQRS